MNEHGSLLGIYTQPSVHQHIWLSGLLQSADCRQLIHLLHLLRPCACMHSAARMVSTRPNLISRRARLTPRRLCIDISTYKSTTSMRACGWTDGWVALHGQIDAQLPWRRTGESHGPGEWYGRSPAHRHGCVSLRRQTESHRAAPVTRDVG